MCYNGFSLWVNCPNESNWVLKISLTDQKTDSFENLALILVLIPNSWQKNTHDLIAKMRKWFSCWYTIVNSGISLHGACARKKGLSTPLVKIMSQGEIPWLISSLNLPVRSLSMWQIFLTTLVSHDTSSECSYALQNVIFLDESPPEVGTNSLHCNFPATLTSGKCQ